MNWGGMVLLLSDAKVKVALLLVLFALVIAGFLVLLELRGKKKENIEIEKKVENFFVSKVKNFMKSDKSSKEKLDFLNRVSKEFFHEEFGTHVGADFSELVEHFLKIKEQKISIFCRRMFNSYYLDDKITDDKVSELSNNFIEIFEDIDSEEKIEKSAGEKIGGFVFPGKKVFRKKIKRGARNENPEVREMIIREFKPEDEWVKNFREVKTKKVRPLKRMEKIIKKKEKEIVKRNLRKLKNLEEEEERVGEIKTRKENYLFHS